MAFDEKSLEKIILLTKEKHKKLFENFRAVLFTALCSKIKTRRVMTINIPGTIKVQGMKR